MNTSGQIQKNVDGHLGTICNNCGGYGFTNNLTGGSSGCQRCNQTGIEPINIKELQEKVNSLETKIDIISDKLK